MIIQSDHVQMGASRSYHSTQTNYSRQNAWDAFGNTIASFESYETKEKHEKSTSGNWFHKKIEEEQFNRNSSNQESMKNHIMQMNQTTSIRRSSLAESMRAFEQIQRKTLDYLLYVLFGREHPDTIPISSGLSDAVPQQNSGPGGEAYNCYFYTEEETTCFQTTGTVITADGSQHTFDISLAMSRSFTEMAETRIDFGKPRLCDPLVINLSGNCANVSDQKFFFDIDADGEKESISQLAEGSGYLALDKNNDGIIGDGSELFGTQSGNGFLDLLEYDLDKNGWIDEADEIFSKLKIWTVDANGKDTLLSLKDADVGAIYLGHESTDFSLNSVQNNQTNAIIRKTGFYLHENGQAGTVQQLDLAT